jgi:hypothetical protein
MALARAANLLIGRSIDRCCGMPKRVRGTFERLFKGVRCFRRVCDQATLAVVLMHKIEGAARAILFLNLSGTPPV